MLKKLILSLMLLAILPGLANAWTITARIAAGSGTIYNGATAITPTPGYVVLSSTLEPVKTLRVTPSGSASITQVLVDGKVTAGVAAPDGISKDYTISYNGMNHTIAAYISIPQLTVTSNQSPLGTMTMQQTAPTLAAPTTGNLTVASGARIKIVATPTSSYRVTRITVNAQEYAPAAPLPAGAAFIVYDVTITSNSTVTPSYALVPVVNTALSVYPASGFPGYIYTFDATGTNSNDTGLRYAFTVFNSEGAVVYSVAASPAVTATFVPSVSGRYTVTMTATTTNGGSASRTASFDVLNKVDSEVQQCTGCHSNSSPQLVAEFHASTHGQTASCQDCHTQDAHAVLPPATICANCHDPAIPSDFARSVHGARGLSCTACHLSVHNPDPVASVCDSCHLDGEGAVPRHPFDTGTQNSCITCHDPHTSTGTLTVSPTAAHYNNITSAKYPASYLTSRSDCRDCHYYDGATGNKNAVNRLAWSRSGHALVNDPAFAARDFKTESGCVQCHTSTGFIAYSSGRVTAAWGVESDKTKELITCIACHSDITTGELRSLAPLRPYADDPYTSRDLGSSNICVRCHSGRNSGASIALQQGAADFGTSFIAPHGAPAAGNLQGRSGYHFPGQSYAFYSSNSHRRIGMGNLAGTGTLGPCVACHTSSADRHLLQPLATGAEGGTAISAGVCANCHGSLDADRILIERDGYASGLNTLKILLAREGFSDSGIEPYFSNTNWGSGESGANLMGAAYNYRMLSSEPGGYAHNPGYARKLISDSIDYLYNGSVTGSIGPALAGLVSQGSISQQTADELAGYRTAAGSCSGCHNLAGSASHAVHQADAITCDKCHSATAAGSSSLIPGSQSHLNGLPDVVIGAPNNQSGGSNFSAAGASCSGVSCHGNGTATVAWGSGSVSCESCHLGAVSVMDGVSAPDLSANSSTGHGKPGIANGCLDCHDQSKKHRGGLGRLTDALSGSLNADCNFCHDDSNRVPTESFRNIGTHINMTGGYSACSDCHDPHGNGNLSMIKNTIMGQPIRYTDRGTDLVDRTSNLGLCQVCHTETKYFRAGVPETAHESTGCLGCHQHKAAAGGFMINPRKQCDSCHGYPPAPAWTLEPLGFQGMNNWSSARFEDYSGGGGSHLVPAHVPREARRSEGWLNCVMCHDPRLHPDDLSLDDNPILVSQVQVVVQSKYRFDNSFTVYTGARLVDPPQRNATGSCFNLSCHMTPSPRWSVER